MRGVDGVYGAMDGGEGSAPAPRVLVPPSRASLTAIGVFSAAIGCGFAWTGVAAVLAGGLAAWIVFPLTLIGASACFMTTYWAARRAVSDEPAMIIDEVGLFDNVSPARGGRMKWHEIERAWLSGPSGIQLLCILPDRDASDGPAHSDVRSLLMKLNTWAFGAPVVIPLAVLEYSQDQVWQHLLEMSGRARIPRADAMTPRLDH